MTLTNEIKDPNDDNEVVPELLTSREVAKILRCCQTKLWEMRQKGTGPRYLKEGRVYRYLKKDLIQYIKDQREKSSSVSNQGVNNESRS
jgi:predicted DNA-binding transcriptional regulator AlpA